MSPRTLTGIGILLVVVGLFAGIVFSNPLHYRELRVDTVLRQLIDRPFTITTNEGEQVTIRRGGLTKSHIPILAHRNTREIAGETYHLGYVRFVFYQPGLGNVAVFNGFIRYREAPESHLRFEFVEWLPISTRVRGDW